MLETINDYMYYISFVLVTLMPLLQVFKTYKTKSTYGVNILAFAFLEFYYIFDFLNSTFVDNIGSNLIFTITLVLRVIIGAGALIYLNYVANNEN